jgi:hypothetical protein
MGASETRKRLRLEATRKLDAELREADAREDLDSFIKKPTVLGPRRPEVEKQMVLRTARLLYSGRPLGLRLGAAIGICRGYSKTGFGSLEQHAEKLLTKERIDRLNKGCPLDIDGWLSYCKHLQANRDLLVLSSLGIARLSFRCRPSLTDYRICMGVRI